jgi:hypothetical protein
VTAPVFFAFFLLLLGLCRVQVQREPQQQGTSCSWGRTCAVWQLLHGPGCPGHRQVPTRRLCPVSLAPFAGTMKSTWIATLPSCFPGEAGMVRAAQREGQARDKREAMEHMLASSQLPTCTLQCWSLSVSAKFNGCLPHHNNISPLKHGCLFMTQDSVSISASLHPPGWSQGPAFTIPLPPLELRSTMPKYQGLGCPPWT